MTYINFNENLSASKPPIKVIRPEMKYIIPIVAPIPNVEKLFRRISKTLGRDVCIIWKVKPKPNIAHSIIMAISIKLLVELASLTKSLLIFANEIFFK